MGTTWSRWIIGVLAALGATVQPAQAQGLIAEQEPAPGPISYGDLPLPQIPRAYDERSMWRARPDKPADLIAREAAAADTAAAACAEGRLAGCSDLGWAYAMGEGRPQNRPVAELIYRKACAADEASACYRLAVLIEGNRSADRDRWAADALEVAGLKNDACRLGSPEGCDAHADFLSSHGGRTTDSAEVESLRRQSCAAGHAPACRKLAELLLGEDRGEAGRREAEALLDGRCRAGDSVACDEARHHWTAREGEESPRARAYKTLACEADDASICFELGRAALRRDPADRATALALLDRACALKEMLCHGAADVRAHPALVAACEGGERPACIRLGTLMAEPLGPFEDRPRALELLGPACEAEPGAHCLTAADLILAAWDATGAGDAARAEAYLERGCASGIPKACEDLADALASGRLLAKDEWRAAELYVPLCEAGLRQACIFITWFADQDSSAPLLTAAGSHPPDPGPEEIAEERAERERADAAWRAANCTTTQVEYEGVTYTDTLCDSGVQSIGGFAMTSRDEARWQAMIWRPKRVATQKLKEGYREFLDRQRVICGGAVVATGWILTAAHCLEDHVGPGEVYSITENPYRIRLGVLRPRNLDEGLSYPILRAIPHPLYRRKRLEFDIALIQYDTRAGPRGQDLFRPERIRLDTLTLAQRPVVPRAPVFAFGWGRTAVDRADNAEVLQGVRLELQDQDACNTLTKFTEGVLRNAALCAIGRNRAQACNGDSGGPLVTYRDRRGEPVLIGVVSGGRACGTRGLASQYTRIGHDEVRRWLAAHLAEFRRDLTRP